MKFLFIAIIVAGFTGMISAQENLQSFDFAGKECKMGFRPGSYKTELVQNGMAEACIIYPDSESGLELAKKISDAIAQKSQSSPLPVVNAENSVTERCGKLLNKYRNKNLILLGNINNNDAIIPLYARFLCYADAAYPGKGGYAVRTIRNPWGTLKNVILIAASDDKGLSDGVDNFLNSEKMKIDKGTCFVDFVMNLKPVFTKDVEKKINFAIRAARNYLMAKDRNSSQLKMDQIYDFPAAYLLTGDKTIERALKEIGREFAKKLCPAFYVGDYRLEGYARMLQVLTGCDILDKNIVRRLDINSLLSLYAMRKQYWLRTGPGKVGSRHQISGTISYLQLCRLLKNNLTEKDSPEIRYFINKMHDGTYAHFKYITENTYSGCEDEGGSQTNITSIFQYAFSYGENAGFKNGLAMEGVKKMLAMTDNLSCGTGSGIYEDAYIEGATKIPYKNGAPLVLASFYFKDEKLKWLQENLPGMNWGSWFGRAPFGLHMYDTGKYLKATMPDLKNYAAIWVKSRPIYTANYSGSEDFPRNRIFDKATVRSGFGKDDAFIAFQGFTSGNSYNTAIDPMALLRFVNCGVLWLATNCQLTDSYWRSGFEVSGSIERKKDFLKPRLDACANIDGISFFSATLPKYRGGKWSRSAVFIPPGKLILMDSFKAGEKDDYSFVSTLRSPVPTKVENGKFIAVKSGKKMSVSDPCGSVLSVDNGIRKMDAQDFWLMRKFKRKKLDNSQIYSSASLISIDDANSRDKSEIYKVAENVFIVDNGQARYLIGKGPFKREGLEFGNVLFVVSDDKKIVCGSRPILEKGTFSPALAILCAQSKANQRNLQKEESFGFSKAEPVRLPSRWTPECIRGFSVSPAPLSGADALDDNLVKRWDKGAVLAKGALTIDFNGSVELGKIVFCTDTIRSKGLIKPESDKMIKVRWAESKEKLKDKPFLECAAKHSPDMRELYKMGAWQVNRFVADIDRKDVAFLEIQGLPEKISELSFFSTKAHPSKILDIKKSDLDGDGIEEIILETASGKLIAASCKRGEVFSIQCPYEIIDFVVGDVNGDGKAEIIAACSDMRLCKYDCNGKKMAESKPLFQRPYTLNIVKDRNNGKNKIALTFYYHAQFFDDDLQPLCEPVRVMGMWLESAAAFDVNGDKVDDLTTTDIYGRSYCVNGSDYSVSKLFWSTNGIARGIFPIGKISEEKRPVLFGGMNKLKAMNVNLSEKAALIWEHSNNDLYADVIVAEDASRIIAGKATGNVIEFSKDGRLKKTILLDGVVRCLAFCKIANEEYVMVGTSNGLSLFDNNWGKVAFLPGNVTKTIQVADKIFAVINNSLIVVSRN